jgi:pyruvate, water dikinase
MENNKNENEPLIKWFKEISNTDVSLVGGKNASLGEMYNTLAQKGINVPDGFAITSASYWELIYSNKLFNPLSELMNSLDRKYYSNLKEISEKARILIRTAIMPKKMEHDILESYRQMCKLYGDDTDVAVRSSATAEDLPSASFAGQHESYLNVRGGHAVLIAVKDCMSSLFTERAIKYREDNGFKHMQVALSVGIQKMVRSDMACSGVAFTLEPESGFMDIVLITGIWGLGENIVQGTVNPDEFYVFKPTFKQGKNGIVNKILGTKAKTLVYSDLSNHQAGVTTINTDTPPRKMESFVLKDAEVNTLAGWCISIEEHYGRPMDIEWAKDGETGKLFIVQARPETTHNQDTILIHKEYTLKEKGKVLASGNAIGSKISSGVARIILSPVEEDKVNVGDIIVTETTNPDWDPLLKKASGIITNKGGRTSHASIVARELGLVAVVGTGDATEKIKDGQIITVSCAEGETGKVYDGKLLWQEEDVDLKNIRMPKTQPMMILGDPDKAFKLSFYPNKGIGLMRLEFIITNAIQIHPMALVKFNELQDKEAKAAIEKLTHHYPDKEKYFVEKLSQAIATIACAFYPKPVIVRMSDFKTNEYANLIGGKQFEPKEENPMIGFRGASRYYDDRYKEGFRLECEAMKVVRNEMGLTNVKLMIPFCRTVEEGKKVVEVMSENGMKRGNNGLEIYVMAEIPSNILLAEEFAKVFDGFSIGSNDLTQLTLGIDRDNATISHLFDERNEAPKQLISLLIKKAKKSKTKVGLCGQAPSDFPEFAQFLVEQGIDSISFNPDALLKGIENINEAEKKSKAPEFADKSHVKV